MTAGAGFIGSHLCETLLLLGHDVICLDNSFTGRRENVRHLLDTPRFELLRHDVGEPLKTVESNVIGTLNMLVLARRARARVLQASTYLDSARVVDAIYGREGQPLLGVLA